MRCVYDMHVTCVSRQRDFQIVSYYTVFRCRLSYVMVIEYEWMDKIYSMHVDALRISFTNEIELMFQCSMANRLILIEIEMSC